MGLYPQRNDFWVIVPHGRDANEAAVLAALLFAPDLVAPHLENIWPANFGPALWQLIARMALSQVSSIGAADVRTICRMLQEVGHERPEVIELELMTLRQIADVLSADCVARCVTAMRYGAAA